MVLKDNIYFNNVVLGYNKMGNMMSVISEVVFLLRCYINYFFWVIIVYILDEVCVLSRYIMSVIGYKFESFLKIYLG